MTHFIAGVIVPADENDIYGYVAQAMSPFDYALAVDGYEVNPLGRWESYSFGGRWDGWINDTLPAIGRDYADLPDDVDDNVATTEQALAKNKIPHVLITPDGQWHEQGEFSILPTIGHPRPNWEVEARRILAAHPTHLFVVLDVHI